MGTDHALKYLKNKKRQTLKPAPCIFFNKLWFIPLLFLLNGCTTQQTLPSRHEADLQAIDAFNREYLAAINSGNIDKLSALTTDDHIMLMPNRPPLVGKQANDAANRRAFAMFKINEQWQPVETHIAGDWAWQRGTFKVTATPRSGGDSNTMEGNFLRIYRRQPDGSWRMIRDMFNSNQAVSGD